jgi:hypothetical protein
MLFDGLIIGLASFLIIGLFHPLVIKGEYYFGVKIWPLFLLAGLIFCGASVFVSFFILRAILAVAGFSSLWSILEIFEQRKRVQKGWFPKKPKRKE